MDVATISNKQKTEFKFTGLEQANGDFIATCEFIYKPETFKALIKATPKEKQEMWNYCHNNWNEKKIATVEHLGFDRSGYPISPVLLFFTII